VTTFDVFGKRTPEGQFELVGGITAPDLDMAFVLAKETHFRHKEGVEFAVRRRGEAELHVAPYRGDVLGGVTDHSYRRQEAYTGVGGRHKRISEDMAKRGLRVEGPRPPVGRRPAGGHGEAPARPDQVLPEEPPSGADLTPEQLAAEGTAG